MATWVVFECKKWWFYTYNKSTSLLSAVNHPTVQNVYWRLNQVTNSVSVSMLHTQIFWFLLLQIRWIMANGSTIWLLFAPCCPLSLSINSTFLCGISAKIFEMSYLSKNWYEKNTRLVFFWHMVVSYVGQKERPGSIKGEALNNWPFADLQWVHVAQN